MDPFFVMTCSVCGHIHQISETPMPIYEYRCRNGHVQEIIDVKREHVDTSTIVCSTCGQIAMRIASVSNFGGFSEPKESKVSRAIRKVKEKGL